MLRLGGFLVLFSALVWASQLLAGGIPPVDSDFVISGYEVVLVFHELLFVFWLGPDIGIYMWSRKVIKPELSTDQRLAAGNVMHTIDLLPRVCLSLMLTAGGILTEAVGIEHPLWQMIGIVLLGPVWLTIVLVAYFREGTALGATVNRIDFWFRWILMISVIISTTFSVVTDRLADAPWVAGKLYLFAALLLFGIMVRIRMRPFFSGLEQMAADGASDALNTQLAASQRAAQPFIIAIWVVMIVQANLGIMQPGSPESEEPVATSISETRLP